MKRSFPLILRSGKTIESIEELIEFALKNPNQIKGEGFAIKKISIWMHFGSILIL
jgi:hypothetical protein